MTFSKLSFIIPLENLTTTVLLETDFFTILLLLPGRVPFYYEVWNLKNNGSIQTLRVVGNTYVC